LTVGFFLAVGLHVLYTLLSDTRVTTRRPPQQHHDDAADEGTMNLFDDLPEEALSTVLQYLDAAETIAARRVCHDWRGRLIGCAYIKFSGRTLYGPTAERPGYGNGFLSVHLLGHRATTAKIDKESKLKRNRVKGHLPEPNVLSGNETALEEPHEFRTTDDLSAAMRMEESGHGQHFQSLDLSKESYCKRVHMQPILSVSKVLPQELRQVLSKPLLKRILCELDLSGLRRLERLSVRGCARLRRMQLPPCLVALDASACTELVSLSFPFGQLERLKALNLSGCRSIAAHNRHGLFGHSTGTVMRFLRELDLSSTVQLQKSVMADALNMTSNLESLSLRYIASDEVLLSLATSNSARGTLTLVDASFSADLADDSVEALVNAASRLQRLNLRACGRVSANCYNAVPLELEDRRANPDSSRPPFSVNRSCQKRKGDNIFFFDRNADTRPRKASNK
jgi:hypothetical protein